MCLELGRDTGASTGEEGFELEYRRIAGKCAAGGGASVASAAVASASVAAVRAAGGSAADMSDVPRGASVECAATASAEAADSERGDAVGVDGVRTRAAEVGAVVASVAVANCCLDACRKPVGLASTLPLRERMCLGHGHGIGALADEEGFGLKCRLMIGASVAGACAGTESAAVAGVGDAVARGADGSAAGPSDVPEGAAVMGAFATSAEATCTERGNAAGGGAVRTHAAVA